MARIPCWFGILFVILIVGVSGVGIWGYNEFVRPGPLVVGKIIIIPRGSSIGHITLSLARHNVIKVPLVLSMGARTLNSDKAIQAGEFFFPKGVSPRGVLAILQSGKQVVRRVTIAEGLTSVQVLNILENTKGLTGTVSSPIKEGEFLPETYYFTFGYSRNALVKRMRNNMKKALLILWASRSPDLPLSNIKEALVLASIVEKETGQAAERARVAGVFINRLRLNMRLQSDPTVSYGITKGQSNLGRTLSRKDLKTPSTYNTYIINGLPPGPISNPGWAALEAATHPANTEDLYFVASGHGGHNFASNLAEHNLNVAKWRKIRKLK